MVVEEGERGKMENPKLTYFSTKISAFNIFTVNEAMKIDVYSAFELLNIFRVLFICRL